MPKYRNIITDKDIEDVLKASSLTSYCCTTACFNFCIFQLCEKSLPKNLCKVYPTVKTLHSFQCILSPQAKRGGLLPLQSLRGSVMPKQSHYYRVEIATLTKDKNVRSQCTVLCQYLLRGIFEVFR